MEFRAFNGSMIETSIDPLKIANIILTGKVIGNKFAEKVSGLNVKYRGTEKRLVRTNYIQILIIPRLLRFISRVVN